MTEVAPSAPRPAMSSWDEQFEQCLVAVVAGSGLTWHDYQRGGVREALTADYVT